MYTLCQEVRNKLQAVTDSSGSISMKFAAQEECTVEDISKRKESKAKSAKGWKIPTSLLADYTLRQIAGNAN